jgi:predicted DNA-binding protein (MmcQ/YjbR family)
VGANHKQVGLASHHAPVGLARLERQDRPRSLQIDDVETLHHPPGDDVPVVESERHPIALQTQREADDAVGVKCGANRDEADEWLIRFPEDATVMAYIGRSGWNTLRLDGAIPEYELLAAVDDSYTMVVATLPKRQRPESWDRA